MSLDIPLLMVTNEPGESKETDDAVYSAAKSLQGKFIVAATSEIGLSGIEAAQLPFVAVFNTQDETTPVYQGRLTTQALVGFAETVATPLVSRLDLTRLAECMKVSNTVPSLENHRLITAPIVWPAIGSYFC